MVLFKSGFLQKHPCIYPTPNPALRMIYTMVYTYLNISLRHSNPYVLRKINYNKQVIFENKAQTKS